MSWLVSTIQKDWYIHSKLFMMKKSSLTMRFINFYYYLKCTNVVLLHIKATDKVLYSNKADLHVGFYSNHLQWEYWVKAHANGRNKCQQLPTLLGVVGQQCCVRLHGPKSLTGFKQVSTSANIVVVPCKRTQQVTTNASKTRKMRSFYTYVIHQLFKCKCVVKVSYKRINLEIR